MQDIAASVRNFISTNFVMGRRAGLADADSLMEAGVVDSTGVLELAEFLTSEFGFEVKDSELVPENLDTIANIIAFVGRKVASLGVAS